MSSWAPDTTHRIGRNIADTRKHQKVSAQQLADRCTKLGLPMTRSALANLENGRRDTLPITDLIVIAAALGVPPITLLFAPQQAGEPVEELPGVIRDSMTAMLRFTGEVMLNDHDDSYRLGRALRSLHHEESIARGMVDDLAEREDLDEESRAWMDAQTTKALQSALSDRERLRDLTGHEPPVPEDLALHYMRAKRS